MAVDAPPFRERSRQQHLDAVFGEALAQGVAGHAEVEGGAGLLGRRHDRDLVALLRQVQGGAAGRPPAVDVVEQEHARTRRHLAIEHVVGGADIVLLRARELGDVRKTALEAVARRVGTGAEDDDIGAGGLDVRRAHLGAQLDLHLQLLELAAIPVQQRADLATLGLPGGKTELTAELARLLDQRHAMAARRRDARHLEAGRAAADDQDMARLCRRRRGIAVPLVSRARPTGLEMQETQ